MPNDGNIIANKGENTMKTLLLAAIITLSVGVASAQTSTVYKCNIDGKTIYSESPCGYHTTKRMDIDTSERMGNETFDRQTIEAARARIRAGMNQTGARGGSMGKSQSASAVSQCRWIKQRMGSIDSASRQRSGHWSQDGLNQEKYNLQKQANELGC